MQLHLPALPTHVPLGFYPTPLHYLSNLTSYLADQNKASVKDSPHFFIKRDDLTGLALGGNKTRKLEFLLADAKHNKANVLITAGAAQSNHCRQTAAAAAQYGFLCHLMLGGDRPLHSTGNLMLSELLGAHIHWCGQHRKGEDLNDLAQELLKQGHHPYVIPYGGSNVIGAWGFVKAAYEIQAQWQILQNQHHLTHSLSAEVSDGKTYIVIASSSGATHAGLLCGLYWLHSETKVLGINIDKDSESLPLPQKIVKIANALLEKEKDQYQFTVDDVNLIAGFEGEGYGKVSPLDQRALECLAQQEGILLDPVYTARAFGALLELHRQGYFNANDKIIFWHTGGAPALFA